LFLLYDSRLRPHCSSCVIAGSALIVSSCVFSPCRPLVCRFVSKSLPVKSFCFSTDSLVSTVCSRVLLPTSCGAPPGRHGVDRDSDVPLATRLCPKPDGQFTAVTLLLCDCSTAVHRQPTTRSASASLSMFPEEQTFLRATGIQSTLLSPPHRSVPSSGFPCSQCCLHGA